MSIDKTSQIVVDVKNKSMPYPNPQHIQLKLEPPPVTGNYFIAIYFLLIWFFTLSGKFFYLLSLNYTLIAIYPCYNLKCYMK